MALIYDYRTMFENNLHNVIIEVLNKLLTAAKNIAVTPVTLLLIQNIYLLLSSGKSFLEILLDLNTISCQEDYNYNYPSYSPGGSQLIFYAS